MRNHMHPNQPRTRPIGPRQADLLRRIVRTNGGGLSMAGIDDRVIAGLFDRHLIQGKAGNARRMVHTQLGLEWVRSNPEAAPLMCNPQPVPPAGVDVAGEMVGSAELAELIEKWLQKPHYSMTQLEAFLDLLIVHREQIVTALLAAPPPSVWQPIESYAGRDHDSVLLYSDVWLLSPMVVGWRVNGEWLTEAMDISECQPTHWADLPAPPATRESVETPDRGGVRADQGADL
jgi:hypothetical protein